MEKLLECGMEIYWDYELLWVVHLIVWEADWDSMKAYLKEIVWDQIEVCPWDSCSERLKY